MYTAFSTTLSGLDAVRAYKAEPHFQDIMDTALNRSQVFDCSLRNLRLYRRSTYLYFTVFFPQSPFYWRFAGLVGLIHARARFHHIHTPFNLCHPLAIPADVPFRSNDGSYGLTSSPRCRSTEQDFCWLVSAASMIQLQAFTNVPGDSLGLALSNMSAMTDGITYLMMVCSVRGLSIPTQTYPSK